MASSLRIVTAPHPSLRRPAKPVERADAKLRRLVDGLADTLARQRQPRGVGLAGPQVNQGWRLFATQLPAGTDRELEELEAAAHRTVTTVYLNPRIKAHSSHLTFGPRPDEPRYEGCLSVPKLYGPVPRWSWIELEYQQLETDRLVNRSQRAEDFRARVLQHELDHLDGVLFTDYSLEHDLPVFQLNPETDQLEELVDRSILEVL
ncbi:MAG: peptide deformylase [Candidatus Pacebacteria bacterium CG10_big_fil_rev_8_21_14_0_10_56_10]|nr:MAG: peptide deformylase [Candidatus Pacebacteria bacterium CG10_big_fil_rev_8_21_14_0_10_56_10]